jgi:hypothetical protein
MPCPFCRELSHGLTDFCPTAEEIKQCRLERFIYCINDIVNGREFLERHNIPNDQNIPWLAVKIDQTQTSIPTHYIKYFAVLSYGVDENHRNADNRVWLFRQVAKKTIEDGPLTVQTIPRNNRRNRIYSDDDDNEEESDRTSSNVQIIMGTLTELAIRNETQSPIQNVVQRIRIPHRDNCCDICSIEDRVCPICYENIQDKFNIAVTNCNHLYCKPCIDRCIVNSSCPCPMCRETVSAIKIH